MAKNRKITVYSVEKEDLPPQTLLLLGVPHILALSVSLDFALSHPGCELEDAMSCHLPPVFSQLGDLRKEERTALFSPPPSDISAVSSLAFCTAILVGLLGLTWGLKGESSHLMSPLTLVSLSVLWGTVVVGLLSLVVVKSDTSTSRTYLMAPDIAGTEWKRGRTCLPFQQGNLNVPREDFGLSPDMRGYQTHMRERNFASVFPPSLFRERSLSPGGGRGPASWKKHGFDQGRFEPYAVRPDRLGGFARAARFGKFRTKGSPRVPLPSSSCRRFGNKQRTTAPYTRPSPPSFRGGGPSGHGFRQDPLTGIWINILPAGLSKRASPAKLKTKAKRPKPNPVSSHTIKRSFLHASKERMKACKRTKPLPVVPSSAQTKDPSQRKIFMGHQPNPVHYPPPNKRGHRGTGYSSESSSSASTSDDDRMQVTVNKEVFGLLSIDEKFALLSRPPTQESTKILQKACFSMHIVRGKIVQSMKKKEKQKRDPSH